jgi:hypothetical protein
MVCFTSSRYFPILEQGILMRKKTIFLALLVTAAALHAENVAEKAKYKRTEALDQIIYLDVPLRNFGSEKPELLKQYADIKQRYGVGLSFFFEDNFVESYKIFIEVQNSLEKLYEQISLFYMDRANLILQQSVKEATDIEIRYNRKGVFTSQRLGKQREAGVRIAADKKETQLEKRLYDPKEIHYLYDKKTMIDNIDYGFMLLGQAKQARQKAMDLEKWLEKGKAMPATMRKSRIESYKAVIELCRQAKVNGIMVMQLGRVLDNYELQTRFKDNYFMKEKRLDPVFDFSIPDEYVKDASDTRNAVFEYSDRIMVKGEEPVKVYGDDRPSLSKAQRFGSQGGNSGNAGGGDQSGSKPKPQ